MADRMRQMADRMLAVLILRGCTTLNALKPATRRHARERPAEFYGSFPVVPNMRGQAALSELGDDVFSRMISYRVSSSTSPSPPQML